MTKTKSTCNKKGHTEDENPTETEDVLSSTALSVHSVYTIAESVGLSNLEFSAAKVLAEDVTFRLKSIVQDAVKFMELGKHMKMSTQDIDHALKVRNIEPLYGHGGPELLPFRFASGRGREIYFTEDQEVDLVKFIGSSLPQLPQDVSLRPHWLAIDGVQPKILENPPSQSQKLKGKHNINSSNIKDRNPNGNRSGSRIGKSLETNLAIRGLSEQAVFIKKITKTCLGPDESIIDGQWANTLKTVAEDLENIAIIPWLITFITSKIRENVGTDNLPVLERLMKMLKCLLDNEGFSTEIEKHLHQIIPSIITCVVSKHLCANPDQDNHWALRDFSSKLIGEVCKKYKTNQNDDVETRVKTVFSTALSNNAAPLTTLYGALAGLGELGEGAVKDFVFPKISELGIRLDDIRAGTSQSDKYSAKKVKTLLLKLVCPILKSLRKPPDTLDEYETDFGPFFGPCLLNGVKVGRTLCVDDLVRFCRHLKALNIETE